MADEHERQKERSTQKRGFRAKTVRTSKNAYTWTPELENEQQRVGSTAPTVGNGERDSFAKNAANGMKHPRTWLPWRLTQHENHGLR